MTFAAISIFPKPILTHKNLEIIRDREYAEIDDSDL